MGHNKKAEDSERMSGRMDTPTGSACDAQPVDLTTAPTAPEAEVLVHGGTDSRQPQSDEYGASVRDWTDLVRRARLGRSAKAVALLLANYADSNGTRIFPGVTRIAVEAEMGYKTVQAALDQLRRAGLIQRVRHAGYRGQADEYRLTIGPEVLEQVEVLSPGQVKLAMERLRRPWRRYEPQPPRDPEVGGEPQPPGGGEVVSTSAPSATSSPPTSAPLTDRPQPPEDPPTHHYLDTTTTHHDDEGVRTDLTAPAPKCDHGFKISRRSDGQPTCALCRREPDNVIPLRRPA